MRRGGGKQKGASFERKICVALSRAVSGGTRHDLYWRSAMSGGRATLMIRAGSPNKTQGGDITAIDPSGDWLTKQFLIECKHVKKTKLLQFLINQKGPIRKWIKTAGEQADGKHFLLIFKENNVPVLVLTDTTLIRIGSANGRHFIPILTTGHPLYLLKFSDLLNLLGSTTRRRPRR